MSVRRLEGTQEKPADQRLGPAGAVTCGFKEEAPLLGRQEVTGSNPVRSTANAERLVCACRKPFPIHPVGSNRSVPVRTRGELGRGRAHRQSLDEGRWVDRVVGLDGVRSEIAMLRTPDGHGRLELSKFHSPPATTAQPNAPVNTLGMGRIMFAVDDIDAVVASLRARGTELVGEVVQYEDKYRLCYLRGPEGILIALAEQLS